MTLPHHSDAPPFDSSAAPETVTLPADRASLRLAWSSGAAAELPAQRLRSACRCAWCTRARHDGTFAASFAAIAIDSLTPIGGYAVNITFTDGHARGIFPWTYLRSLAETASLDSGPAARAQHGHQA